LFGADAGCGLLLGAAVGLEPERILLGESSARGPTDFAASAGPSAGRLVRAKRRLSILSSFSVTAASMTAERSPSGTDERIRSCSRSSFPRSSAEAVN
jgi:hypothetical protein